MWRGATAEEEDAPYHQRRQDLLCETVLSQTDHQRILPGRAGPASTIHGAPSVTLPDELYRAAPGCEPRRERSRHVRAEAAPRGAPTGLEGSDSQDNFDQQREETKCQSDPRPPERAVVGSPRDGAWRGPDRARDRPHGHCGLFG
jgi:hypothetical protein